MRELTKEIVINDETYVLRKMNAFDGAYLIKFVTSKLIPILTAAQDVFAVAAGEKPKSRAGRKKAAETSDENMFETTMQLVPTLLDAIDRDDLEKVMTSCLNFVDKRLPGGDQPVMKGKNFGIEGLEYDTNLCLTLSIQSAIFNVGGFFGENGLGLNSIIPQITSQPNP